MKNKKLGNIPMLILNLNVNVMNEASSIQTIWYSHNTYMHVENAIVFRHKED